MSYCLFLMCLINVCCSSAETIYCVCFSVDLAFVFCFIYFQVNSQLIIQENNRFFDHCMYIHIKSCVFLNYQQLSTFTTSYYKIQGSHVFIYLGTFAIYTHAHVSKHIPETIMHYVMMLQYQVTVPHTAHPLSECSLLGWLVFVITLQNTLPAC